MSKKDLFRIIIKLFGLYAIVSFIVGMLTQLVFLYNMSPNGELLILFWIIFSIVLFVAFAILLIFQPDCVIKLFKLDKGFDSENIELGTIDFKEIISFAIFIIGGFFILHSFAPLLLDIGHLIREVIETKGVAGIMDNMDHRTLYVNIINIVVGFLLISNYHRIALYLIKKGDHTTSPNE